MTTNALPFLDGDTIRASVPIGRPARRGRGRLPRRGRRPRSIAAALARRAGGRRPAPDAGRARGRRRRERQAGHGHAGQRGRGPARPSMRSSCGSTPAPAARSPSSTARRSRPCAPAPPRGSRPGSSRGPTPRPSPSSAPARRRSGRSGPCSPRGRSGGWLVYAREAERREAFARRMADETGIEVEAAPDAEAAVREADVDLLRDDLDRSRCSTRHGCARERTSTASARSGSAWSSCRPSCSGGRRWSRSTRARLRWRRPATWSRRSSRGCSRRRTSSRSGRVERDWAATSRSRGDHRLQVGRPGHPGRGGRRARRRARLLAEG